MGGVTVRVVAKRVKIAVVHGQWKSCCLCEAWFSTTGMFSMRQNDYGFRNFSKTCGKHDLDSHLHGNDLFFNTVTD